MADSVHGGALPEFHFTEVDGVRTVWTPIPGPVTAILAFGVGMADEVLPDRGLSHIVEHLALSGLGRTSYPTNGFVDLNRTVFHARGTAAEVSSFLTAVTGRLGTTEPGELASEVAVLRSEASQRNASLEDDLLAARFGARRHGLVGFREFGLNRATVDTVRGHARQWFTAGNAVLGLTGSPPADLRLALEADARPARQGLAEQILDPPGWRPGRPGVAGASMLFQRSVAATIGLGLLNEGLHRRLRTESSLSYAVGAHGTPLTADTMHVLAFANIGTDQDPRILRGLVDGLHELAESRPPPDDIDHVLQAFGTAWRDPATAVGLLDSVIADCLLAREQRPLAEWLNAATACSSEELQAVFSAALASLILSVPAELTLNDDRVPAIPAKPVERLDGKGHRRVQPAMSAPPEKLVASGLGLSLVNNKSGAVNTIRWKDCAALLKSTNGSRTLIDDQGGWIRVQPWLWAKGGSIVEAIDGSVPRQLVVPISEDAPKGRHVNEWIPVFVAVAAILVLAAISGGTGLDPSRLAGPAILATLGWSAYRRRKARPTG